LYDGEEINLGWIQVPGFKINQLDGLAFLYPNQVGYSGLAVLHFIAMFDNIASITIRPPIGFEVTTNKFSYIF
jgi:hypothetical protein